MPPRIVLTDTPEAAARDVIAQGLGRYNEAACGPGHHRPLAVLMRDVAGEYVGGLWGRTAWRWLFVELLFVELLFVPEPLRRSGLGRDLMGRAEAEAIDRGCIAAWLDTFSFQSRTFYERLGYSVFGTLEGFPPGHTRFFMRKTLAVPA